MISLQIDVDNLWMYEKEYALKLLDNPEYIYLEALPRLLNILDVSGSKATFMVTGRDLLLPAACKFCQRAVKGGHELGNHSYSHPVNFRALAMNKKDKEISETHKLIIRFGKKPVGFRAPGYAIDHEVLPLLSQLGYRYDASLLPGWAQVFMTKYASTQKGAIKNKTFGQPKDLWAKTTGYPLLSGKQQLTELPISVLPWFKTPIHSTFAYYGGNFYQKMILNYLKLKPKYMLYLLHAIDFVDVPTNAKHPIIPLRYSLKERLIYIEKVINSLVNINRGPLSTAENQLG